MYIPFNKPFIVGNELDYILDSVKSGKISGDGKFTAKCIDFFVKKYHFQKCLLTTSCTDALEMAAILIDIRPGDEVIIPSYTFVSTVNAFVLRGAKIVFADSRSDHPGVDEDKLEALITSKTKAIVPVHYAGVACDMDKITALASRYDLFVVEDAAQAIDAYYLSKSGRLPLGSIGQLGAFSFHETKNIICGEGGMLVINDEEFNSRAEIIREKGTNRSAFFRGEVDKYGWVDIGSSFLPSDMIAAFLYAQLENIDRIQRRRMEIWNRYASRLSCLQQKGVLSIPYIPSYATNNAHMFYIVVENLEIRSKLITHLKKVGIHAVFHYISLHRSPYYVQYHNIQSLPMADFYSDCLLRLPFYFELSDHEIDVITNAIVQFFE